MVTVIDNNALVLNIITFIFHGRTLSFRSHNTYEMYLKLSMGMNYIFEQ